MAFDRLELEMGPRLNVIFGDSGTGKSSILRCLRNLLRENEAGESGAPGKSGKSGRPGQYGELGGGDGPLGRDGIRDAGKRALVRLETAGGCSLEACVEPGEAEARVEAKGPVNIRVAAFLPGLVSRGVVCEQTGWDTVRLRQVRHPPFACARGVWDWERFVARFQELEALENRAKVREYEEHGVITYSHPAMDRMREAMRRMDPACEGLSTARGEDGRLRLAARRNGLSLDLDGQASASLAMLASLVGELALSLDESPAGWDVLALVDEIEMGLPPRWQVRVCRVLAEVFPEVQFVLTSHSPLVWSGLEREEVVWLVRDEEGRIARRSVPYAMGGDLAGIAGEFFGVEAQSVGADKGFGEKLSRSGD